MGGSLVVVGSLVHLVTNSVLGGRGTVEMLEKFEPECDARLCLPSANGDVAILGNLLVGLLRSTGGGTLDGLRDVVESLLGGLHCEDLGCLFGWGEELFG